MGFWRSFARGFAFFQREESCKDRDNRKVCLRWFPQLFHSSVLSYIALSPPLHQTQCGSYLKSTEGKSILGHEFADKFPTPKHNKTYTVSILTAGPNINSSQFLITTDKIPWLEKKHTIFRRTVRRKDPIHQVEQLRVF